VVISDMGAPLLEFGPSAIVSNCLIAIRAKKRAEFRAKSRGFLKILWRPASEG